MEETPITRVFKRMPEEPITRAYKSLNRIIKDHKIVMDHTTEMYHSLFVQSLHLQKDLQSVLARLLEAAPELAEE